MEEKPKKQSFKKKRMRLSELVKMGYSKKELRKIYLSREINRKYYVSCKMTTGVRNSPIIFDTEQLQKYFDSLEQKEE